MKPTSLFAPHYAGNSHAVVLAYHHFTENADAFGDALSVRLATLEAQLAALRALGYQIVPLRALVGRIYDPAAPLPPRAAALTVDDGHGSIYRLLRPLIVRERVPVTLFVHPPAISHSSGAMLSWRQLRSLAHTGLVDVQAHAWWHPDLLQPYRQEAQREASLKRFRQPREQIEQVLGTPANLLAWPFGMHTRELETLAAEAGYVAAFTIEPGELEAATPRYAIPRMLITEAHTPALLRQLLPA
jgi:peptidoglycan/xylan/chitin deacetylase (PgdA/CDA1 family)